MKAEILFAERAGKGGQMNSSPFLDGQGVSSKLCSLRLSVLETIDNGGDFYAL
jgi:hypothetical protein